MPVASRALFPLIPALILALWIAVPGALPAQDASPVIPIGNANWTATDALGRTLPTAAEAGPPQPGRRVGMFYWQWHGPLRQWAGGFDMTEFLKTHPGFKDFTAFPEGGPDHPTWYWAEPLFGYYRSADPWVIRKHLVMLADAGVDFVFMDYTNAQVYDDELATFLAIATELKSQGVAVPRISFFLNHEPDWKVEHLYKKWYLPGQYDDLWFRWEGKPLLLSPRPEDAAKLKEPAALNAVQEYFTWRPTWAFHDAQKEPAKWRFMDRHPQSPALGPDGRIEQMVVAKSLGGPLWNNMEESSVSCVPGHVPVYDDQWLSPDAPKGLFFEEQWRVARETPAPILLVTGWNEWTASVWETPGVVFLGRKTVKGQGHIVDEFNMEFNRDLEPMKGGYFDNYYWQFVANMRRYKGMVPPPAPSAPATIAIDGDFADWAAVQPVYADANGDVANRDWDATVKGVRYTDNTARNDLTGAQLARDHDQLYFSVTAAARLSPASGRDWMVLLIDADANPATGWHGYDYLVNRLRIGERCSVEHNVAGQWQWERAGLGQWAVSDNRLELAVPRQALGLQADTGPLTLDFKWTDNLGETPALEDFYLHGDVAPGGRFNYRFEEPPVPIASRP